MFIVYPIDSEHNKLLVLEDEKHVKFMAYIDLTLDNLSAELRPTDLCVKHGHKLLSLKETK